MAANLAVSDEKIIDKIYFVRGLKVMFDKDLAEMYGVTPRRLREQIKRNIEKFPGNFMFQLNNEEVENMVSQNATPSKKYLGGHLPYVFTEHGVLMLANVLRSKNAVTVSIRIIELFIKMREILSNNKDILIKLQTLESKMAKHDEEIAIIFKALKQMLQTPKPEPRRRIGFKAEN